MDSSHIIIPETSPVYQRLHASAESARAVVFSGLPGVGKSLYITQFKLLAQSLGRHVTMIQWDVARKAFETKEIAVHFPMGDGVVHNGVKLCAGNWLMDVLNNWLLAQHDESHLLLIEAPLAGHRFVELAHKQNDVQLEAFLSSAACHFIVPIPSLAVRDKIEAARRAQVSEDAQVWSGAKPSVMLMVWKMICGVANDLGRSIPMEGQPPYDPEVYEYVYGKILQRRQFMPLIVDEVFDIPISGEAELHDGASLIADSPTALKYAQKLLAQYPDTTQVDEVVASWYLT